jgi:hypothetical protein
VSSPLRISFDVACSAEHAFDMWTARIGTWWPSDHTVSGDRDTLVVLEGRVGGRIFERTGAGVELEWGVVTVWEPHGRLGYLWHLGGEPNQATDVEVRFVHLDTGKTRVEIEHRGWERLGPMADTWRDRNRVGWETLLPNLAAAINKGDD